MSRSTGTRCASASPARAASNGHCGSRTAASQRSSGHARSCPARNLLQYIDEEGNRQDVTSTDVNDYLKEITGKDITAKDFRTWAGTVLAAMALNELESFDSAAQAKRNLALRDRKGVVRGLATRRRSAANATSIRKCSTPTWMAIWCWNSSPKPRVSCVGPLEV